jgi:transcriptional regulator with GAF, ATPase, and Fis domain
LAVEPTSKGWTMTNGRDDDLARQLADMARLLLGKESVQDTLDAIVRFAVEMIDGCDHAGILTARRDGTITTTAGSDDVVRRSDELQARFREGPCYDALRQDTTFETLDMSAETRWPRYAPRAAELGIASAIGFQLSTGDGALAALDLFATEPHAFTERSRQVAAVFAAHAAVAMAWARTEAQLREAIISRQLIGEATGIVMERHRISSSKAFGLLRQASQRSNKKVVAIAEEIVETGEDPAHPRRS